MVTSTRTVSAALTLWFSVVAAMAQTATSIALNSTNQGSLAPGAWAYYRVDVPANGVLLWRAVLRSTSTYPDLYVRQGQLPTASVYGWRSQGDTNDVIALAGSTLTPGASYYIGVYNSAATNSYTLFSETPQIVSLAWDPGTNQSGSVLFSATNAARADFYFKLVTPATSALGAWRTVLNVSTGEAGVYLTRGSVPTAGNIFTNSARAGSDGFVLQASKDYNPSEDWYYLVRAEAGAKWSLVAGEPYVQTLGNVAANQSSDSGSVVIGPEAVRYFKTTVSDANTLAWRLWTSGATNQILVRQGGLPFGNTANLSQNEKLLVVPPFLAVGQTYYMAVIGTAGQPIYLESRIQDVTTISFEGTNQVQMAGCPYTTFRVDVPDNQIAWQLTVQRTSGAGDPNFAVRRGKVPSEFFNEVFSEAPSNVVDSVTLVPPTTGATPLTPGLSAGTYYITVYANAALNFTLKNGAAEITTIGFDSETVNTDTNRAGWRFFLLPVANQYPASGWELFLKNHTPGTRLVVRRVRAPGIWSFRDPALKQDGAFDIPALITTSVDFIQRTLHEIDTWYIGVYNPTNQLGSFSLVSHELPYQNMAFDDSQARRDNVEGDWFQFFRIDVTPGALGWDLRLTEVTSGSPKLYIWHDSKLPATLPGARVPFTSTTWPLGMYWDAGKDWTDRPKASDGMTDESGRVITLGMGRPLEPGTYFVGVKSSDTASPDPVSYTLVSRGIGAGLSIPVEDLDFVGGVVNHPGLPPREVAYYRVQIPTNTPSWKVTLTPTAPGDALLAVCKDTLPNIAAVADTGDVIAQPTAGKKMNKAGKEIFMELSFPGASLQAGTYYLAVVSEGLIGANNQAIGTGSASYLLESTGPVPVTALGTLNNTDLITPLQHIEGGDAMFYQFNNQTNLAFEIFMENTANNFYGTWIESAALCNPGMNSGGTVGDPYGNDGGYPPHLASSGWMVSAAYFGVQTIGVKARKLGSLYPDAAGVVRVHPLTADPLGFDGGTSAITQNYKYRFFRVDVPANAQGWDLRLSGVTGVARMVVCRNALAIIENPSPSGHAEGMDPNWPWYRTWVCVKDWTQRDLSSTGASVGKHLMAVGMGRPLEAGTYYVGIHTDSAAPVQYTITSRGIGSGFQIPVQDLAFSGGAATNIALAPRQADYYRVVVPANTPSWQLRLRQVSGEAMMVVLSNTIPNSECWKDPVGGRMVQKVGNEHYVMLPPSSQTSLAPGNYYVAVVGEGSNPPGPNQYGSGTSSYILESRGALAVTDLGTLNTDAVTVTNTLEGGEIKAYSFAATVDVSSLDALLQANSGSPVMVIRAGAIIPKPGAASVGTPSGAVSEVKYSSDGGRDITIADGQASSNRVTIANPNGTYTLIVMARGSQSSGSSSTIADASYVLKLQPLNYAPLAFDGEAVITNQSPNTWRYFQVEVPPDAVGWDVRVADVLAGSPQLVVRRDQLPSTVTTTLSSPQTSTNWPSGKQWAAADDWTGHKWNATGAVLESGRLLAMGLGQPLEPGTYYVGIYGTNTLSYIMRSRGIGDGHEIAIKPLNFAGGTDTVLDLPAREAVYYRVDVPSNAPSWKLRLSGVSGRSGESLVVILTNFVPNVLSGSSGTTPQSGYRSKKTGNDHFVVLPESGKSSFGPATYYLAVVSEGSSVTNDLRIGPDRASLTITSVGASPVVNLGQITSAVSVPEFLEGGETRIYQFNMALATQAVEVVISNRYAGNPVGVLRTDSLYPKAGDAHAPSGLTTADAYGYSGGSPVFLANTNSVTLANATNSTVTLAIKARLTTAGVYPDAGYTLVVQPVPVVPLGFGTNTLGGVTNVFSGFLRKNQRAFFRVEVPTNALGWELLLDEQSGQAMVRVKRDALPSDFDPSVMPFARFSTVLAPPYLTNGTFYIEVMATNSDALYTLTSRPVEMRANWTMPQLNEINFSPGMLQPFFGGTDVGADGQPAPGDPGTELGQGQYHFYAVTIPTNNVGLLHTELIAVSGNPDLYLRVDQIPTYSHNSIGSKGSIADRFLTNGVSEYGNWVPLDGRKEFELASGIWYLAVRAAGNENVRYQLRVSTGRIEQLDLANGLMTSTTVATDWKYYRVPVPDNAPANWTVAFTNLQGQVEVRVRDTVPPGSGINDRSNNIVDWITDKKNNFGYRSFYADGTNAFLMQPLANNNVLLRPGSVYYIGVRGLTDSSFQISSTGTLPGPNPPPSVPFFGGSTNGTLAPNGSASFRFSAPPDAFGLNFYGTNVATTSFYIENGTFPNTLSASNHWKSAGANATLLSRRLDVWPWVPNMTYYLTVTNTAATAQNFSFRINGGTTNDVDYDNDTLPDYWEYTYFTNVNQTAAADFDKDGLTNLEEMRDGTDPTDPVSCKPRLTILATNGVVLVTPLKSNYVYGETVTLLGTPDAGFNLQSWIATNNTTTNLFAPTNPLVLCLRASLTVRSVFKVPGDDFAQRQMLTGTPLVSTGSNADATREPGELFHAGINGQHSLWWGWTAPINGQVRIATEAAFSHALGVYTGNAFNSLTVVTNNIGATNIITVPVTGGQEYKIAVDSSAGLGGPVTLRVSMPGSVLLTEPTRASGVLFDFTVSSDPGTVVVIQASSDLVQWVDIGSVTNTNGAVTFHANDVTNSPQRFYRTLIVTP